MVLTPRRWRQVGERDFTDDGGNQARSPGRARNKPLKPLRREGRCSGEPVVTNSRAFYTPREAAGATGTRLSLRPLIFEAKEYAQPGRESAAGRRRCVSCGHCERSEAIPSGREVRMDCFVAEPVIGRAFDERRVQGGQSHASGPASPRSPQMTIFWHCGLPALSSKTASETHFRQPTVNGFGRGCCSKGSGNADSQRFGWSSGGSGDGRSCPGDSGCVRAKAG